MDEKAINQTAGDQMGAENNALLEMELRMLEKEPAEGVAAGLVSYRQFLGKGTVSSQETKLLLDELERQARLALQRALKDGQLGKMDASCEAKVSSDGLTAWLFLFPPLAGGKPISGLAIRAALTKKGVNYGLDDTLLAELEQRPSYLRLLTVATGTPPVEGTDGWVEDRFPRERETRMRELADNEQADYKDLGWLHPVHRGDVICDVIPAVEPIPGRSVISRKLEGRRVQRPVAPIGKNTALNSEGTALVAEIDGQVAFVNGRFTVEPLVTISGNVDASIGNINVLGDVIVEGDVLEGFTVKASGNIVIKGVAGGATLIAGGSMSLKKGMNGNNRGTLEAQADIFAKFLENCSAQAGGSIFTESLVNCNVNCNDRIEATSGHGIIVGGTVVASNSILAKVIGNPSHRRTNIVLGSSPQMLREIAALTEEVRKLSGEVEATEKNVLYLERIENSRQFTPDHAALLGKLRLQLSVMRLQHSKKSGALETLRARQKDMSGCSLQCDVIYPATQITIGRDSKTITAVTNMCNVYFGPNGITIGLR